MKKLGEKYKWVILVSCALSFFGLIGIGNNVFSVFIVAVTEELGIMRTAFTTCLSLMFLGIAGGAMVSWKIYDRIGMLRTERIASVLFIASYITVAFTQTLPGFYVRYALMGFCLGLTTSVPLAFYLRHWFGNKSGFAIGIAFMGSGFAGVLLNPIAEHFISGSGWRNSFLYIGIGAAFLVLIPVFFLLKDNPDYVEEKNTVESVDSGTEEKEYGNIGLLLTCICLFSICGGNLFYTITPFLEDIGYSSRFAAVFTSITMAILAVGKITQGIMVDRIGLKKVTVLSFILAIVGLGSMACLFNMVMLVPILAGMFMVNSYNTVALPLLPKAVVRPEIREKSVGWFSASGYLGYAISPVISALVYDFFGSYVPIYIASAIIMIPLTFIIRKFFR